MKLIVQVDGRGGGIEIDQAGEEWSFRLEREGDAPVTGTASALEVEPGIYSILWDGASYEAKIMWAREEGVVDVGGEHFAVRVADPRETGPEQGSGNAGARHEVVAPMPGKVIRVLVAEGEEVVAGQGIVVVEAMKMQNEMRSNRAGRVTSVRARAGDAVAGGDVLAVIE